MSAAPSQTRQERAALHAAWLAHPQVIALDAAVAAHVRQAGLTGVDGMSAALAFAAAWITEHGMLPESGVLCD